MSDTGGRHGVPSTGDGKNRSRPPIGRAEVRVQGSNGNWMWKAIASLWGDKKAK
jgi:hypothetical protein